MVNKVVIANLKMNMTASETDNYLNAIEGKINSNYVVFCPTSIYTPYFLKNNYLVGLQNIYYNDNGSYTGEISPAQASSMGIDLVIIGHSERRIHFKESNKLINSKIKDALKHNLKVVLCIGEDAKEYQNEETNKVLKSQLIHCLEEIESNKLKDVIIAYEPVWSIGTGMVPADVEIESAAHFIKNIVKRYLNYEDIPVIYGGSVNDTNIAELNRIPNISGFLVGGASLDAEKLLKIIEVVVN